MHKLSPRNRLKRHIMTAVALLAFCAVVNTASADPAAPAPPVIKGEVEQPVQLTRAFLKSLPAVTVDVQYQTEHGPESGQYVGVPLWFLLRKVALINAPGKNGALRHSLLITGSDGYAVSVAYGELDPNLEAEHIIIAYQGGEPPASFDHLRLVIPEDHYGARYVRDITSIEIY